MTTIPPIPPHGEHQTPEERRQFAQRFIIDARQELETGNRLQAGEKAWGAVVQMFKIAAERRGWNHNSHSLVRDMGFHLLAAYPEYDSGELNRALFAAFDRGHRNFYENWASPDEVTAVVEGVEEFLPVLDTLAAADMRTFVITSRNQPNNLRNLTGNDSLQVGDRSDVGFSLRHQPGGNGSEDRADSDGGPEEP